MIKKVDGYNSSSFINKKRYTNINFKIQ